MKSELLWVSICPVSKDVTHAGGQALYSHVMSFAKTNRYNIKILYLEEPEYNNVQLCSCVDNIKAQIRCDLFTRMLDIESKINIFNANGSYIRNSQFEALKRELLKLKASGYRPDIVVLNWTETVSLATTIKKCFCNAKIVAIEEDVSFLKRQRNIKLANSTFKRVFYLARYKWGKKCELSWLRTVDLIATYSQKDADLLIDNGIESEKIFVFSPVFKNWSDFEYHRENSDIVFWGAMSRKENYLSAIWFIENVMPLLKNRSIRFVIVGANPPEVLKNYCNHRIIVTGFVDSVEKYFKNSLCMVVPLVNGAGIKIKVLEGLSSGIPVISNSIGIEGISARSNYDYIHAETPAEFKQAVENLLYDERCAYAISLHAKKFIKDNYDEKKSVCSFIQRIEELNA